MSRILSHQADASFICPRLRVFLSADLIGSTQFKIDHAGGGHKVGDDKWWPSVTMLFYSQFQKLFFENFAEWRNLEPHDSGELQGGPPPKLWKVLGDELIFFKECWEPREALGIVQVWRKTLIDFAKSWPFSNLKIKSGAWLVGTPIRNWEIAFLRSSPREEDAKFANNPVAFNFHLLSEYYSESERRKINIDFIGPSMDGGFRLLAHSDERRFVLSADLVEILCEVVSWWDRQNFKSKYPPIQFYYSGTASLKGITRLGVHYPIVWLDNYDGAEVSDNSQYANALDALDGRKPVTDSELRRFLAIYLKEMTGFPQRPYIACIGQDGAIKNSHSEMTEEDAQSIEKYREIYLSNVKAETEVDKSFQKGPETDGSEPTDVDRLLQLLRLGLKKPDDPK